MKVVNLEPSHTITEKIFGDSEIPLKFKNNFLMLSDGNPGAAMQLVHLYNVLEKNEETFEHALKDLFVSGYQGPGLYLLLKEERLKTYSAIIEDFFKKSEKKNG